MTDLRIRFEPYGPTKRDAGTSVPQRRLQGAVKAAWRSSS